MDTACVKVVVEAAHMGIPERGAMQEAGGPTVQPEKPGLVVTGVWGRRDRAGSGKGGAPGRGRGRGALAGTVVLDHQVLDAVHSGVEGEVPAAGAGRAPSAECIGAQGTTQAT